MMVDFVCGCFFFFLFKEMRIWWQPSHLRWMRHTIQTNSLNWESVSLNTRWIWSPNVFTFISRVTNLFALLSLEVKHLFLFSSFQNNIIYSSFRTSTWICWLFRLTLCRGGTRLTVSGPLRWSAGLCWDRYHERFDLRKRGAMMPCPGHFVAFSKHLFIYLQVVGANLLPDAVTWLYTRVLSGLHMHGQYDGCNAALTQLALLIYDALVFFIFKRTHFFPFYFKN